MLLDASTLFMGSYATGNLVGQLITALGATVGQGVIDTAPSGQSANQVSDVGAGQSIDVLVQVKQALTSAGAATVQFQIVQADDVALTSNVQVLEQTDAYPYTTLTAGTFVPIHWDRAAPYAPKRYVGVRVVVATAVLTNATGQFVAAVAPDVVSQALAPTYKSGIVFQ